MGRFWQTKPRGREPPNCRIALRGAQPVSLVPRCEDSPLHRLVLGVSFPTAGPEPSAPASPPSPQPRSLHPTLQRPGTAAPWVTRGHPAPLCGWVGAAAPMPRQQQSLVCSHLGLCLQSFPNPHLLSPIAQLLGNNEPQTQRHAAMRTVQ